MTKVGFIVIVGAIVLVAFLVLAIINARKQWSYLNTPSEVFKQKLSKPRNWYKDRKKSYNQRLRSFYDGKIKIYRRGNRHH